jgi:flavin-binding protein dodecin
MRGIQSAWIADQEAMVKGGKVVGYQVRMKLTFLLDDKDG